jgi:hypothetical protein
MGKALEKLAKLQLEMALIEGETWAIKQVLGQNVRVNEMPKMNWKIRLMKDKPKKDG